MTGEKTTIPVLLCALLSLPAAAQEWSWPEKAQNLQVLPEDWPGERLRPPMMGFTRALGVDCSYCHVGEENQPLSTYDFASDANPNKERAREMLRMLGAVNGHLQKIEPSGEERVNMWCHTCHRGRPRPMTLDEELSEVYAKDGGDSALEHYDAWREEFYGKGAYDFESERTLNRLGYEMLGKDDVEGAIKVFTLNTEKFPESANAWDSLGEGHLKAGNKELSERFYEKSLEIDPTNQNARDMLKKLAE